MTALALTLVLFMPGGTRVVDGNVELLFIDALDFTYDADRNDNDNGCVSTKSGRVLVASALVLTS